MTSIQSVKRPASRWHMVLAAAPALLFAACMAEPSDPSPLAPENEVGEKAGCTHIRFCSTPGFAEPHVITCDTNDQVCSCLLYTSDAADERSSVDLGGRR